MLCSYELQKSLPLLRQSMVNNELVIDGIRPPPASVVAAQATTLPVVAASAAAGQVCYIFKYLKDARFRCFLFIDVYFFS